ncbi:MAG TPA: DHA2 family efflux MFS transporter permease subunit [Pseudonocardia sp.]|uniref:DHA2 family efflux MFS transporter permease subunit n=1 Tax=Pseudonocardia sp. TaxID=60912 RepID=UPI002BB654EC|nr:DHA2 family efflux MFS transporter permease subunit [Pseudonocardia sp.]HTF47167.1 DHA2 family efflux MFS transporter permease subunit [Pseudonocardia sp.]
MALRSDGVSGGPAAPAGAAATVRARNAAARSAGTGGWVLPLAVLIVGMFMSVLDISIVNVAVPSIQKDFGTTSQEIQWITTAYSLALGVIVPVSGWLGDRAGLTRAYIVSLLGFCVGSALCGMAWDLNSMIVFRILQAIPGGIMPVVTLAMVYRIAPKDKIGTAMGLYGLGVVFAPAVGPTLGGYLVEHADWRLIFLINVPIGLVGAVLAMFLVPRFPISPDTRLDVWGFLTVATGLFALLLALSQGQDWGWTGYRVLILITVGVLSLALFVVIELHVEQPLIDVRVFKIRPFTNSLLLLTVLSVGLFAVLFYIPLFVQEGQGITPVRAGLMMLPEAIAMGAIMPVAGQLYDRFGPRWPAVIGLLIAAYGTYLLCGINADVTLQDLVVWTWIRGVGNGLAMMAIMTAGLDALPARQVNEASAVSNAVQRVSASLGLAVLTAIATAQQAQLMADRASLVPAPGPAAPAALNELAEYGLPGLFAHYQRTQLTVMASAYSDVFLILAIVTAAGAILAVTLKMPPRATAGTPQASEGQSASEAADRELDPVSLARYGHG